MGHPDTLIITEVSNENTCDAADKEGAQTHSSVILIVEMHMDTLQQMSNGFIKSKIAFATYACTQKESLGAGDV